MRDEADAASRWSVRPVGGVVHEVGVLLGEGWVYCMGVGGSCSMDNPWTLDPGPRGVRPLGCVVFLGLGEFFFP